MSNDYPAEFEAAIRAERLKRATQLTQPVIQQITSPVSKTLQQLKDKATASELTLIEAVQAAVWDETAKKAREEIYEAGNSYLRQNPLPRNFESNEWVRGLGDHLQKVMSPKTDTP